ncbi:MAG: FAD-dependent oxidoreductase [Gemmatimonadota bacterium]
MSLPHVVILGGGPAGVGAAYQIHRAGKGRATLFEANDVVGGNAGSFDVDGVRVDFGSHRLHAACDREILADIQSMLGDDFGFFERHGRIRLRGRWLHFPLKPLDLLLRLDKPFALGAFRDMVRRALPGGPPEGQTFASVLKANLGPTICDHFYFPYARKMWGLPPEELSGIQARKRVTAGSFTKLIKRLAKPPGKGGYYYMRRGYGQISEGYAAEAERLGADLRLGWKVDRLSRQGSKWVVEATRGEERTRVEADQVWSTIPVSLAARMIDPPPPAEVLEATRRIDYRAMVLAYLTLDVDQFTTTDAHYFPEENVCFTRLSEPKNYFRSTEPRGRTVLCAEIPCTPDDDVWRMDDEALGRKVAQDMEIAGLGLARPPIAVRSRRLRQAYPIYPLGYEVPLDVLHRWIDGVEGLLSYGRQGLFAHDNTHHALYMAYAAVDCLDGTGFDRSRWDRYREVFKTHVVED